MPKEGRKVNRELLSIQEQALGPGCLLAQGQERPTLRWQKGCQGRAAKAHFCSVKYSNKALGVGVVSGEKVSEAMEGAYSKNKDAQIPLPPLLVHLLRVHMNEQGEWWGWVEHPGMCL